MADFSKLQKAVDDAQKALDVAIDREFPIGCVITVNMGRGWMSGEVVFPAQRGDVKLRAHTGKVHHKHYSRVQRL